MFQLISCVIILILCYCYLSRNYNYWKRRNVKHDKPVLVFGNNFRNYIGTASWTEIANEQYAKYPTEKVVGFYRAMEPELMVKDLDTIRQILNVDFSYFYPRGLGRNPKAEPILYNLFQIDGDIWKLLRQRLTPAFTTGKLKGMFPLIVKCAEKLQAFTETIAELPEYDVRDLMARFTIEFIGACGFGIEMDAINNENSLFRDLGKRFFTMTLPRRIRLALKELFPDITRNLGTMDRKIEELLMEIFLTIIKQRNYKPIGRNDFIDLLLELKEKGTIVGESIENRTSDGTPMKAELDLDLEIMAAQVTVFFAAGFETSSSATSFTLHQLAFHPNIQQKVHEEIDRILAKYNNKLSYEAVNEMKYLEMVFKEALRIFPSLGILKRVCAKRYTIPGMDITIDPGVKILIPVQAIQNDETYFERPNEFIPERFSEDNAKYLHKYVYLPFGEGPRSCIGARLGQMQSLAGLAAVLQKFRVEPSMSTRRIPEVSHVSNIVQSIKGGLPLHVVKRDSTL